MQCDHCHKEQRWLEMVGKEFICHTCLSRHKLMGNILRTHIDTFQFLLRKLKPVDYAAYMAIQDEQIATLADLKPHGISL